MLKPKKKPGGTKVGNFIRKVDTKVKKSNLGNLVTNVVRTVNNVKAGNIGQAIKSGKKVVTTTKKIIKNKKNKKNGR